MTLVRKCTHPHQAVATVSSLARVTLATRSAGSVRAKPFSMNPGSPYTSGHGAASSGRQGSRLTAHSVGSVAARQGHLLRAVARAALWAAVLSVRKSSPRLVRPVGLMAAAGQPGTRA